MQRLRPLLGPPKRLRRERAPLPGVKLSDGRIAPTVEDNLDRWVEHFAAIEGGSRLSLKGGVYIGDYMRVSQN